MTPRAEVELSGLDGLNLLGFLAAMGTLIALDGSKNVPDVRLRWTLNGSWRPVLSSSVAITHESIVGFLAEYLGRPEMADAFKLGIPDGRVADNLTVSPADYRRYASKAAESASVDSRLADFAASFACDAIVGDEQIQDTAFRTMSGAGHQHFLKFMRQLVETTSSDHLQQALFEPWAYRDDSPSMRWDPEDDRRYALRWKEPATDKIRTVRGANRLAVEGLRLFPSMPRGSRLQTTGFRGKRATDTKITWPLWTCALPCAVVRSVLALSLISPANGPLNDLDCRDESLSSRGIAEVVTSSRITIGKFRSFTPASPL